MTENDFNLVIKKELDQSNKGTIPFRWDIIWQWVNQNFEPKKLVNVDQRVIQKTAGALLPCPFCGSKAKEAIKTQIICSNKNCIMNGVAMHDTIWNQRVNSRFSV